ncbi:MAG: hypothetical protein ACE1ZS_03940, partial [Candidatus Poribacteria bacterium]
MRIVDYPPLKRRVASWTELVEGTTLTKSILLPIPVVNHDFTEDKMVAVTIKDVQTIMTQPAGSRL